jgi:hypothetical protein
VVARRGPVSGTELGSGQAPPRPTLVRRIQARLARLLRTPHPTHVGVAAFAVAVLVVTALLMLPAAAETGKTTTFREALFTATSAVCVTGLAVVDTPTHWSAFGEVVILVGIQAGGFGIMTLASLLGLLASRRLALRTRLLTSWETKAEGLGDVRRVLRGVARTTVVVEGLVAVALTARFWLGHDQAPGQAIYSGVFHAVSSFNNAGFSLYSDNLMRFTSDPYVCLPIAVAVVLGGLGFPVLFELRREPASPKSWSLHTKTTLLTYALLLVGRDQGEAVMGVGRRGRHRQRQPGGVGEYVQLGAGLAAVDRVRPGQRAPFSLGHSPRRPPRGTSRSPPTRRAIEHRPMQPPPQPGLGPGHEPAVRGRPGHAELRPQVPPGAAGGQR